MKMDITTSQEQYMANGFADHVIAWAMECQALPESLPLLRHVAREVCAATTAGHVCIYLSDIVLEHSSQDEADMRRLLMSSGVIGTPTSPNAMPLILDDDGRLYLHRYYDYEHRLALRLMQSQIPTQSGNEGADDKTMRLRLNALFGTPQIDGDVDWQRMATALAMQRKLLIISGGPGTGKTTTIVNLLACMLEDNPNCRIVLAAPTGKAAARMQESIRARASHLSPEVQSRLPEESFTIHRLLGVMPPDGRFRHHVGNPLPLDALIVDEASMLDIALATKLFDAVPVHARIILLGDKDQLSAVEAGAVFSELSADPSLTSNRIDKLANQTGIPGKFITPPTVRKPSGLRDSVIWFSENYRFSNDSGIGKLSKHISSGQADESIALLRQSNDTSLRWLEDSGKTPSGETSKLMQNGYAAYLSAIQSNHTEKKAIFDAFDRFRILCAIKEGPRGVDAVNRQIDRHFRKALKDPILTDEHSEWYPGRPIIILRNDYLLKLFNGDIGITLIDTSNGSAQLMVCFPDNESGFRAIAPSRLPEHETAYAITVHKSQGSEFESILLMMPETHNRVTTRELVYTAITRARHHASISGSEDVLRRAISSPTQRNSGLSNRMKDVDFM